MRGWLLSEISHEKKHNAFRAGLLLHDRRQPEYSVDNISIRRCIRNEQRYIEVLSHKFTPDVKDCNVKK